MKFQKIPNAFQSANRNSRATSTTPTRPSKRDDAKGNSIVKTASQPMLASGAAHGNLINARAIWSLTSSLESLGPGRGASGSSVGGGGGAAVGVAVVAAADFEQLDLANHLNSALDQFQSQTYWAALAC